jgi:DNA-binding beta-propeller fold protein YncE
MLIKFILASLSFLNISFAQTHFNKLINAPFVMNKLSGTEADGLSNPRDLDFHTDQNRNNELWVINENSATFDLNFGGSTVTYYDAGLENQWVDYRRDSYSSHFMNTASAIAFSNNGGFANTLDVKDANGNQNGYFSGCTLWDSDTSIYARVNQNGPELGSHWDMLHQSPYSVGIAAEEDNIYWLFDGYHNTIAKYNFQEPHPDHEHGGENHSDGIVYRYDEIVLERVSGLSSHIVMNQTLGELYICDTGNQRILRMNTNSGSINYNLTPYGENIEGYYSMNGAEYETIIDSGLVSPTGIDIYDNYLLVSDYSTGEIIVYDISQENNIQEIKRLQTNMINEVMGIKVGPDGSIWYVCTNSNKLYQMLPPMNGDLNGDNSITLADFMMILAHIVNSNSLSQDFYYLADVNSDSNIDIFDLIFVIDSF